MKAALDRLENFIVPWPTQSQAEDMREEIADELCGIFKVAYLT